MSYSEEQLTVIESLKTQSLQEMLRKLYEECENQAKIGGITPVDMPITHMGPNYKEGLEGIAQMYTDTIDLLRAGRVRDAIELWNEVSEKKFPVEQFRARIGTLEVAIMVSMVNLYPTSHPVVGFMTTCKIVANHLDKMLSEAN